MRPRTTKALAGTAIAVATILASAVVGAPRLGAQGPVAQGVGRSVAVTPDRTLRVYSNNIENLVLNNADGGCTPIDISEHLASMLVDDDGATGTGQVAAPDLLLFQQLSGADQADAYADQLSAEFGYPQGTYRALVAWADPEPWGASHECRQRELGQQKKTQTNGIIYNSRSLSLVGEPELWSAGWLSPGTRYADGAGCRRYEPPTADARTSRLNKWKRTTSIGARFAVNGGGPSVFAASMHLPQQNRQHACAGPGDPGIQDSGIGFSVAAQHLLLHSEIRVLGVDANRTKIGSDALQRYGLVGYGSGRTVTRSKIDYLFVHGAVRPSPIEHTVVTTASNHRALYGFIDW